MKFEGTPLQIGEQIWMRLCNPAVHAATSRTERERGQLYCGLLMAAMGSMAADFGHELAVEIARELVDALAGMGDELKCDTTH